MKSSGFLTAEPGASFFMCLCLAAHRIFAWDHFLSPAVKDGLGWAFALVDVPLRGRKKTAFLLALSCALFLPAAEPPDPSFRAVTDPGHVLKWLAETRSDVQTLQGHFQQRKKSQLFESEVLQEGRFFFQREGGLRWEYLKPRTYAILFVEGDLHLIEAGQTRSPRAPGLKSLQAFIAASLEGRLDSHRGYDKNIFENQELYRIDLASGGKGAFQALSLYVDKGDAMTKKVVVKEKNGDRLTLRFARLKKNQPLPEGCLSLRDKG